MCYLAGHISEILVFDKVLTADEEAIINHYLAKKWGLEDYVDSDGDGYVDSFEETVGTSPIDSSSPNIDFPMIDTITGLTSELDSVEKTWSFGLMQVILILKII